MDFPASWLLPLILVISLFGNIYGINPTGEYEAFLSRDGNLSDVSYYLWTRYNSGDSEYYTLENGNQQNLANSPFDGTLRTYFYYHGMTENGLYPWILNAKTDHLTLEDCNIISVDWENLATIPYEYAAQNVYPVSNLTADFIEWLVAETSLTPSQIHITGFSMGGQCAGMTGFYIQSGLVDRVTGLDPAGPIFDELPDEERISVGDASFVDIIHTNGHTNQTSGNIGLYQAVGDVDFYPNGGLLQPGCPDVNSSIPDPLITGCSHLRAQSLWVESILGATVNGTVVPFTSWPCEDWPTFEQGGCQDCGQGCLEMGLHTERNLAGKYYLRTHSESPYAMGNDQGTQK